MARVVDLVCPLLPTPAAVEGRRLVANTMVSLSHVLLHTGSHVRGELAPGGLAVKHSYVVLIETRSALNNNIGG